MLSKKIDVHHRTMKEKSIDTVNPQNDKKPMGSLLVVPLATIGLASIVLYLVGPKITIFLIIFAVMMLIVALLMKIDQENQEVLGFHRKEARMKCFDCMDEETDDGSSSDSDGGDDEGYSTRSCAETQSTSAGTHQNKETKKNSVTSVKSCGSSTSNTKKSEGCRKRKASCPLNQA